MDVVLFFQSTSRKSWRVKLAGAFRFAKERDWLVQVVEGGESGATESSIREALALWRPVGCLVDRANASGSPPDRAFGALPAVYLDQDPARPSESRPCVLHDSAATVRLAAAELLAPGTNRSSCAFVGPRRAAFWSVERAAAFREAARGRGLPFSAFEGGDLPSWLASLARPCAILAANDCEARMVANAARSVGLRIPEDISLCGVDNDELYCESGAPGISSVEPDFASAGFRLAAMLALEIDSGGLGPVVETYGPSRLVRRDSTRILRCGGGGGFRVRRALEAIRAGALRERFGVDDVARAMGCSRRLATLRFREATGRTILEEILDVRFNRACELLRDTDKPVFLIVSECGYASGAFFKRHFASRTGMTMSQWRDFARSRT